MSDATQVQNGNFAEPPGDETLPIGPDNQLNGWTFTQSVGTGTIEAFWVADSSGAGGHIEWVATAAATGDEAYLEQLIFTPGNASLSTSHFGYVAHGTGGATNVGTDFLRAQYLDVDGVATGTEGTTGGMTLAAIPNDTGVVPADGMNLRLQVGLTVTAGPKTGTHTVSVTEVRRDRATTALRTTDLVDTTIDPLTITQEDGEAIFQSGDGAQLTLGAFVDLGPVASNPVIVRTFLDVAEQAAPATPSSTFGRFYVTTAGVPRFINDGGTDSSLTGTNATALTANPAWAAKGDTIAGTANDTAQIVTVGADGSFYVADSTATPGVKWASKTDLPVNSILFPATQVASANANSLDDYEEGTFTPVLTFGTPGNLSVAYSTQVGRYQKVGNRCHFVVQIITSTFTHTTAAGAALITGLPFTSGTTPETAAAAFSGWTRANVASISAGVAASDTFFRIQYLTSAAAAANFAFGDMPSGGSVVIRATGSYEVA